jgi:hypothetical protein
MGGPGLASETWVKMLAWQTLSSDTNRATTSTLSPLVVITDNAISIPKPHAAYSNALSKP